MKKIFRFAMLFMATLMIGASLSSCSDSDDNNGGSSSDIYKDPTYGQAAISSCDELVSALNAAYRQIGTRTLTPEQEAKLKAVLENNVDNVIVPTYTNLADAVVKLQAALGDLSASQITQSDVDKACAAFKEARAEWEKSEAFLLGPADGFDVDPHIDSWPLSRAALLSYFANPSEIQDESILGFHALEFILFRDGKNRKASDFSSNDTYKGFESISGAQELKYAEEVAKDLLVHTYQLQVAWDPSNASRLQAVKAADLDYQTAKNNSFGANMKNAGNTSISTFATIKDAVQELLTQDKGCVGICNEVGGSKIANPFSKGDISYVESPYSYNSIKDFQDNIRSVQNIWYGNTNNGATNTANSFHAFFTKYYPAQAQQVETAINNAIKNIGNMPSPFVKYVSVLWNKVFEDEVYVDEEE